MFQVIKFFLINLLSTGLNQANLKIFFFFTAILDTVGILEGEKFPSALVAPNFEELRNWCTANGLEIANNQELIKDRKVSDLFGSIVKELNKSLSKDEQVRRFRIVPDEWSPDSGELSPTLKLKRHILNKKYSGLINEIFNKETAISQE